MSKKIDTLVQDIYHMLETKEIEDGAGLRGHCDRFGREMGDLLYEQLQPETPRNGLRLSGIGQPLRKLHNRLHGVAGEPLRGPTYLKFLYGHITEALVLALTRISGHEVTEEQKVCTVAGVKGHQDCRIDGFLIDVKSASSYGFKKFKNNTLHKDDPFGYIAQIKAYAHEEGDTEYGWLAMDKQNGTLALLKYDETHTDAQYYDAINWDVEEHVKSLKKQLEGSVIPSVCYEDIPDGKSGNRKLSSGCSYCDYKRHCWPDLKVYYYSNGPRYLTHVEREPKVAITIPEGF